jgi:hypothetical protein
MFTVLCRIAYAIDTGRNELIEGTPKAWTWTQMKALATVLQGEAVSFARSRLETTSIISSNDPLYDHDRCAVTRTG